MGCVSITGEPGSGKSTLAMKVVEALRAKGVKVCGIVCPEVREGGKRIGFKVVDLASGRETWLARVEGCDGAKVGKYRVCNEASEFVIEALSRDCDVFVIDEIGPMELKLPGVREKFLEVLNSGKPFLVVRHLRLRDSEIANALRKCKEIFKRKWVEVDPSQLVQHLLTG